MLRHPSAAWLSLFDSVGSLLLAKFYARGSPARARENSLAAFRIFSGLHVTDFHGFFVGLLVLWHTNFPPDNVTPTACWASLNEELATVESEARTWRGVTRRCIGSDYLAFFRQVGGKRRFAERGWEVKLC